MTEEIVQVFQRGGRIHVRVLAMPEDPAELGQVLVDAARVVAEVYRRQDKATTSRPYLDRIVEGIQQELQDPTGDVSD